MKLTLPDLPYPYDALTPHLSAETLELHHDKHHKAYVDKANKLLAGTEFEPMGLDDIVRNSSGSLYNNAAQVWNHNFFWQCMKPRAGGEPKGELARAISARWGTYAGFREAFGKLAEENFGAGWTWLVKKADGSVDALNTGDAGNPLTQGDVPLLTIDVWEHAYYIDYRNQRPKWIERFLASLANWEFAQKNYSGA